MPSQERDLETERAERESFIVLQHAYTLAEGEPGSVVPTDRLGLDLGFDPEQIASLVRHLVWVGYLTEESAGRRLVVTREGVDYIERLAWRRRSVRSEDRIALTAPRPSS